MTQNGGVLVFDLPAQLDAESAAALVVELRKLPQTGEIRFNAAAVTAVPLSYLQLLLSAFKTFANLGVSDASADFADAFAGYGLDYPIAPAMEPAGEPVAAPPASESVAAPPASEPAAAPPASEPAAELPTSESAAASLTSEPEAAPPASELVAALPTSEPVAVRSTSEAVAVLPAGEPVAMPTASGPITPPPISESAPVVKAENEQTNGADMSKTILTIDDSRTMRDMLKMALSGAGYTVVQAVDGEDGLNVLAQQGHPVDLIITDINMPKLDGFGVIRAVRNNPQHDDTPILVLSTEGEQESKDIAKDAGATGWIVKPFDPDSLVNLVNKVCA